MAEDDSSNKFVKIINKIKSFKNPLKELDKITDNENLAALLRRKFIEEKLNISLAATGSSILDFVEAKGKIAYKPIGAVQVPVTVAGPLTIEGLHIRSEKYIPLASIYPELMESVDLGAEILSETKIRVKTNRCWLRLFTIAPTPTKKDLCKNVEDKLSGLEEPQSLKILCYGRGAGHIINTVIIGDYKSCTALSNLVKNGLIDKILTDTIGSNIPIVAPYLVYDMIVSTEISRGSLKEQGIEPSVFIETYNSIEDLKPIDNSILPVILGSLTSFYLSIGIKPEYALRSDIKQYMLATKFRKITVNINPRIILPYKMTLSDLTLINREIFSILKFNDIDPHSLAEIGSALVLTSYIGLMASIAKVVSLEH